MFKIYFWEITWLNYDIFTNERILWIKFQLKIDSITSHQSLSIPFYLLCIKRKWEYWWTFCYNANSLSRFNRTRIRWSKDNVFLTKSRKFKISQKGALRIVHVSYRDSGIYTCHASLSSADLKLTVKPKPGDFPSQEEYEKYREDVGKFSPSSHCTRGATHSKFEHQTNANFNSMNSYK